MTGFEIAVLSDGFRDYGVVGTQPNRHSHGSGNLGRGFQSFPIDSRRVGVRIPACAGMTNFEITVLSGMTGFKITVLSERNRTVIPTEVGI
ncbi:Uncharacterised protein [Neisseria gonorrhoeae]|uniref:Uncharacterized protein n=1 Tax=Neisseria gonorrhoeae TaxID=485 RepID=A0A378W2N1_NEIGO|nr:Uncharacterised protein [Neisseria gonorrhoeae]